MNKYLIVGLGNVGHEYSATRHNVGFDVVDAFAYKHEALFVQDRHAAVAKLRLKGKQVIVVKPSTYMNLSGKAVKYWMDKEKVLIENTLTIVDEIALPLTKMRIRPSGSAAGSPAASRRYRPSRRRGGPGRAEAGRTGSRRRPRSCRG